MAKPLNSRLAVVTASLGLSDATRKVCVASWDAHSRYALPTYTIQNTYGVVPAFAQGVALAFAKGAEAVCCFHDDLRIDQDGWDVVVQEALDAGVQFAGFGGAPGLGHGDLYRTPYNPHQLARQGFLSNMGDAEAHGVRVTRPTPCVVFDGFSQIGTRDWFEAAWQWLGASGIVHHAYDAALGCLAARAGVQPGLLLPVRCHHYGGRTAVGNPEYTQWAFAEAPLGDQGFWEQAHWITYNAFKDVLPLRVRGSR